MTIASSAGAAGGAVFGYTTAVIAGSLPLLTTDFGLSTLGQSIVTTAILVGGAIGAMSSGLMAEALGRRKALVIGGIAAFVGSILSGLAPVDSVWFLVAARVITGFGVGIASVVGPTFISEIAPPELRGRLIARFQLALTIGILASYVIALVFVSVPGGWRWMFALGAVPAGIQCVLTLASVESPRWLAHKDRSDDAFDVLGLLRTGEIDSEFHEIAHNTNTKSAGFSKLLKRPASLGFRIALLLAIAQVITGINVILYYAPIVLSSAGFASHGAAIAATISIGAVNVIATWISLHLVDRFGRRPLLLLGLGGMAAAAAVIGASFLFEESTLIAFVTLFAIIFFVICFAMSLGTVVWMMVTEVLPSDVRGKGVSVAMMVNWLVNIVVTLTFLIMLAQIGSTVTFWLFSAISVAFIFYVYFDVPETKGKSLEEIEKAISTRSLGESESDSRS